MRDQKALALQCMEVEDAGGSVIEFLKGLGFISAAATWERLQLNELGRLPNRLNDGKGKKIMGKLTIENKKRSVQLALSGKNPLEYIRSCGVKNAAEAWGKIKRDLKEVDPETFEKLPKRLPNPKKDPEGTLADAMQGMKDAADGFFGACKDMGLNVEPKEEKPRRNHTLLRNSNYIVSAIRTDLGEFYYDKKFDRLDWRTIEGDEVSMSPAVWFQLYEMIPEIMGILEVTTDREE